MPPPEPAGIERLDLAAVQRRTLVVVVASQVLGGAGLAAGVTVGALIAEQMLGGAGASGLPAALFTLGSATAAFLVSRSTQRSGRRLGLAAGFVAGGIGAVGVVAATAAGNVILLFVALFVYGAGTATNLQARYAGADLAAPGSRGSAISVALVSTAAGAVAGPNLAAPSGASRPRSACRRSLARSCSPPSRTSARARCWRCSSGPTPTCSPAASPPSHRPA